MASAPLNFDAGFGEAVMVKSSTINGHISVRAKNHFCFRILITVTSSSQTLLLSP